MSFCSKSQPSTVGIDAKPQTGTPLRGGQPAIGSASPPWLDFSTLGQAQAPSSNPVNQGGFPPELIDALRRYVAGY
jgi:hypothetical protein